MNVSGNVGVVGSATTHEDLIDVVARDVAAVVVDNSLGGGLGGFVGEVLVLKELVHEGLVDRPTFAHGIVLVVLLGTVGEVTDYSVYEHVAWAFIENPLLAIQCFPAVLLLAGIKMLPDSPHHLTSVGRYEEAREVLVHVRGVTLLRWKKSSSKSAPSLNKGSQALHYKSSRFWWVVRANEGPTWVDVLGHVFGCRSWPRGQALQYAIWLMLEFSKWLTRFGP